MLQQAIALHQRGRLDEAARLYRMILAANPRSAEALHRLGLIEFQKENPSAALELMDRSVTIQRNNSAYFYNRGLVLVALKRFDDALTSFDRALAIKPGDIQALNNRGNVLLELKRFEAALSNFNRGLAIKPDFAEALNNRGRALHYLERFDDALDSYDRALTIKSDYPIAFINRGTTLKALKRFDDEMVSYDRALAIKPGYAEAHFNRGMARLRAGNYRDGWADYDWRWKAKDFPSSPPRINGRQWRGEDIDGYSILIFAEQGMGDVIQFARYLPLLAQNGAKVFFYGPEKLVPLLGSLDAPIELITSLEAQPSFDFQCAMMSLPMRFSTDLSSIPGKVPYLCAKEDLITRWKRRLGEHGFKVGIAWQGNPQPQIDQGRSIPLAEFVALSGLPGVRLISLQKGDGVDQLARLPANARIEVLGDDFDEESGAFIDTAAVMENLDLIITSDTSIAHLAGALARPIWVALQDVPDWRWMRHRNDSPWYPTMRLFRQPTAGDWQSTFSTIAQALQPMLPSPDAPVTRKRA